jgi:hypothetical protein
MPDAPSKKDAWDRITALATILVPAAIALAGFFISQGLKQAEISSEERRAEQTRAISEANTKISQESLINAMMKSLTSSNPRERKLAVEAVLIALPDQGPVLVRIIAQSDEDKTVQAAARDSLEQRVSALIRELFSEDKPVRIGAAQDLIKGWRDEPKVVLALVEFATKNRENSNGVYNTVVVLNEFSSRSLQAHKQKVLDFIEVAKATGSKTEAKATALLKRLGG